MPYLMDKEVKRGSTEMLSKKALNEQRQTWADFFAALDRVAKINPA